MASMASLRIGPLVAAAAILFLAVLTPLHADAAGVTSDEDIMEEAATDLAGQLDELGALGAYWDSDKGSLTVIRPADGLFSNLDSSQYPFSLEYLDSPVLRDDYPNLKAAVIDAYASGALPPGAWGVSLDYKTGLMVLEGPKRSLVEDLLDKYAGRVEFVEDLSEGHYLLGPRSNDVSPFSGGARVVGTFGYGQCTLGFAVHKNGLRYILTAGHCYPFQTGGHTVQVETEQNHALVGTVQYRTWPAQSPNYSGDAELIGDTYYTGRLYNGTTSSDGSLLNVGGSGTPLAGIPICYDGSTTFLHCGVTIVKTNVMKCFGSDSCVDHLAYTNSNLLNPGDSGGPVYRIISGSGEASARGLISAKEGSPPNVHEYFYQWDQIQSFFNLTICTTRPC